MFDYGILYKRTWLERLLFLKRTALSGGWISDTFDTDPYHYRRSPSIGHSYNREYDEIVGASVPWNQLVTMTDGTTESNGITWVRSNGTTTANGTATAISGGYVGDFLFTQNHVYYFCGCPSGGSSSTYFLDTGAGIGQDKGGGSIGRFTNATALKYIRAYIANGYTANNVKFTPQLFDLTLMLGSTIADYIYTLEQGTAGAGIAWLKKYFDLDTYHAYDSGSIKSVSGLQSHDMVGKNLIEPHFYKISPGYAVSTGTKISSITDQTGVTDNGDGTYSGQASNWYQMTTVTKLIPNTSYRLTGKVVSGAPRVCVYLTDSEYVIKRRVNDRNYAVSNIDYTFTTTSDEAYLILYMSQATNNTTLEVQYPQLEFGSTATPYKPYQKNSYPLDSTVTLRGLLKLADGKLYADGDVYKSSGEVTRKYAEVDLGSLEWDYNSTYTRFKAQIGGMKLQNVRTMEFVCAKYVSQIGGTITPNVTDKVIYNGGMEDNIYIHDLSYSDPTVFKSAISGVKLVYPIQTPTTSTAQPYQKVQKVDMNGTEEYVSTSIVPIGHQTKYAEA